MYSVVRLRIARVADTNESLHSLYILGFLLQLLAPNQSLLFGVFPRC